MFIIALDLGSTTGIAYGSGMIPTKTEKLNLVTKKGVDDNSFLSLAVRLIEIIQGEQNNTWFEHEPIAIVCERPNVMKGWHTNRVHFGLYGVVQMVAGNFDNVCCTDIPATTIKAYYTGSGRADKEAMVETTQALFPHITDHNESDAVAVYCCAKELLYGNK